MKAFKASMRFSKGKVRVSSTCSLSSSGFDGLVEGFLSDGLVDREFVANVSAEALGEGPGVATSTGVGEALSTGAGVVFAAGLSVGATEGNGEDSTGAAVADGRGVEITSGVAVAASLGVGTAEGVGCGFSLGWAMGWTMGWAGGLSTVRGRSRAATRVSPVCGSSDAKLKLSLAPI